MNYCIEIGRLVADPEIRYSQGENAMCVARFRLAVDRIYKREGEQEADFISCIAFGKNGEFAEKYFHKGMKVAVCGRIQTGSYTNKDGAKVYTTDLVVERQEFCESKNTNGNNNYQAPSMDSDGFVNIPAGIEEDLPFA